MINYSSTLYNDSTNVESNVTNCDCEKDKDNILDYLSIPLLLASLVSGYWIR